MKWKWIVIVCLVAFFSFRIGKAFPYVTPAPTPTASPDYTGQELFDAVNSYRESKNLPLIKLSPDFCNNIVSRWELMSNPDTIGHEGFEEWAHKYLPAGASISEIAGPGNTPQELVNSWVGSPSHRLSLDNATFTWGCAYATNGYGVVELGRFR